VTFQVCYINELFLFFSGPKCTDVRDEGKGTEKFLRYFYDSKFEFCVPFFYKGEGGNSNRFNSDKDCMRTCSPNGQQIYPTDGKTISLNTIFVDFT